MNPSNNKLKLLVVDDSEIVREILRKFFEDYSFDVVTCSNGLFGIKEAIEQRPSIIFLDILMPNFNGIEMLKVIKSIDETKNIPVVVITANNDKINVLASVEAGAEKIIAKPLSKNNITKALESILGKEFLNSLRMQKLDDIKEKEVEKEQDAESGELRRHLIRMFLKTLHYRKSDILSALEARNELMLKGLMHDLRGVGTSIGYPKLTLIGEYLEVELSKENIPWKTVDEYGLKAIDLLNVIKAENSEEVP
jgi:CheY-like chemotaxis protein